MNHEQCRYLLNSLSEYIDGSLEDSLCKEIERHLAGCENCRVVVDTLRKTVSLYREDVSQNDTPEEIRHRLFKRLNLDDLLIKNGE